MSQRTTLLGLSLGILCLVFAPFSFADGVYEVSGTVQTVGNSGCDPSVCTETINFKFGLAPFVGADGNLYPGFYGISLNTTGPLNGLGFGNPEESFNGPNSVLDIKSFVGGSCATPYGYCTEIDFNYTLQKAGNTYSLPSFGAQWFTCEGTCGQYFTSDGQGAFGFGGDYSDLTVENVTFSQVPEPPAVLLIALGGICAVLFVLPRTSKLNHLDRIEQIFPGEQTAGHPSST
jgi:hypothetical protein